MKTQTNESTIPKLDALSFRALSIKKPQKWIIDAALDWSIIATTIAMAGVLNSPIAYLAAVLIVGNRQHALAILGHDGTHFSAARKMKLNDTLTDLLAFWPIGLTTTGYRNLHFKHHKYANTEADPELQHRKAKAPQWDLPMTTGKVARYAVMDMVGYSLTDYLIIVALSKPDKKSEYVGLALFHLVVISAAIVSGFGWVAAIWYFSLPTSFMMFFRLRTWLEHQGSDDTHILHLNLAQRIVLSPHNAWYHYEHHHYPSVPYYNLPRLRKILQHDRVLSLDELIKFYRDSGSIQSGHALKKKGNEANVAAQKQQAIAA